MVRTALTEIKELKAKVFKPIEKSEASYVFTGGAKVSIISISDHVDRVLVRQKGKGNTRMAWVNSCDLVEVETGIKKISLTKDEGADIINALGYLIKWCERKDLTPLKNKIFKLFGKKAGRPKKEDAE